MYTLLLVLIVLIPTASYAEERTIPSSGVSSFIDRLFDKKANFDALRKERRTLVRQIHDRHRELADIEAKLLDLRRSLEQASTERRVLDIQVRELDYELGRWQLDPKSPPDAPKYVLRRDVTASARENSALSFDQLKQRKASVEQRLKSFADREVQITELERDRQKKQDAVRVSETSLIELEEAISGEIGLGANQYLYRTIVSLIYAGIVAFLVLKFFRVVEKDDTVKANIFAGDTGIQFITLFSIVIAVILFGILEILGANELSALLGGLSGYILGKTGGGHKGSTRLQMPEARSGAG